jgi:hypothetical protein
MRNPHRTSRCILKLPIEVTSTLVKKLRCVPVSNGFMGQIINKFLILNQSTEAEKHKKHELQYWSSKWWPNLPVAAIFIPENLK